mgnify:CR=1 FL=1
MPFGKRIEVGIDPVGQRLGPGDLVEQRAAILERRTTGVLDQGMPIRDIGARRLLAQQMRGLAVTPRKVLGPIASRLRDKITRTGLA